jgi:hypothetical protein
MTGILEFRPCGRMVRTLALERGQPPVIGRAADGGGDFEELMSLCLRHCRVWEKVGQVWFDDLSLHCANYASLVLP